MIHSFSFSLLIQTTETSSFTMIQSIRNGYFSGELEAIVHNGIAQRFIVLFLSYILYYSLCPAAELMVMRESTNNFSIF
jgi:hypothetical protein